MRFLSGGMLLLMFVFSFAGCKNQQPETSAAGDTPPPVPPAIAPGHIALTGTLSGCNETERALHCMLTVAMVQEYGSGTMQMPTGTEVLVSVRQAIADEFRSSSSIDLEGTSLSFVLVAERPAPDDDTLPAWRISAIDAN